MIRQQGNSCSRKLSCHVFVIITQHIYKNYNNHVYKKWATLFKCYNILKKEPCLYI